MEKEDSQDSEYPENADQSEGDSQPESGGQSENDNQPESGDQSESDNQPESGISPTAVTSRRMVHSLEYLGQRTRMKHKLDKLGHQVQGMLRLICRTVQNRAVQPVPFHTCQETVPQEVFQDSAAHLVVQQAVWRV